MVDEEDVVWCVVGGVFEEIWGGGLVGTWEEGEGGWDGEAPGLQEVDGACGGGVGDGVPGESQERRHVFLVFGIAVIG